MREELKEIYTESEEMYKETKMPFKNSLAEVCGTARYIKKDGKMCLLRDVLVDDNNAFDPDIYAAIEDHLWTDYDIFEKNKITQNNYFRFYGNIYEYKRKDGTIDYSIKINKISKIDFFDYFKDVVQQFYCRDACPFFEHCYYNCCMPEEEQERVKTSILTEVVFNALVKSFEERYEEQYGSSFKMLKKDLKKKTSFNIGKDIFLGIYKTNIMRDYGSFIKDTSNESCVMNPVMVDGMSITPILGFLPTGMCSYIAFEVDSKNTENLLKFLEKKYNTHILEIKKDDSFLTLLKLESTFEDVTFTYLKNKKKNKTAVIMSMSTASLKYMENIE